MKRKYCAVFAVLALGSLMFTACPLEHRHEPEPPRVEPWGIPPFSGYSQGQAIGFQSMVIVRLYLYEGIIYDAFVDPSGESEGWWEALPVPARLRIIENNGMNITLDGLSGPSTIRAVFQAGERALLSIPGVTEADL